MRCGLPGSRKSFYLLLAGITVGICLINLEILTDSSVIRPPKLTLWRPFTQSPPGQYANDTHPITDLMRESSRRWQQYDEGRSTSFRGAVVKYRQTYGRHPPPGFKEWYTFAREHGVYHVDDFQQISGDLRPYWAIRPHEIRRMAARLQESNGIAGIRIRNKQVFLKTDGWRAETLVKSIKRLAGYLPDMDIAMNVMDQPRVLVPYEVIQEYLHAEAATRNMPSETQNQFTSNMSYLYEDQAGVDKSGNPEWFSVAGKHYMEYARDACPHDSPAQDLTMTSEDADKLYKSSLGGFVANFTGSSDLCTVGSILGDKHGFLFSASSNTVSRKLLPVFSECKTSVNNDILFPANMYFLKDPRYQYDPSRDVEWHKKNDSMIWRGVTSGGVQLADNWQHLHRQRFVQMANGTEMNSQTVSILTEDNQKNFHEFPDFLAGNFSMEHFDVGFTEAWGCIPDCSFYEGVWTYKEPKEFAEQFEAKYLADIDGHSFSGRWRAFQQSRSLGIKATIFREWHDSRLFAWTHFVPMDNRYDDLYALMTYFLGLDSTVSSGSDGHVPAPKVSTHDFEAEMIATQSREWAQRVLRDEDLDIYLYLLLLEYGRILDDNREHMGYSGDGSELDDFDAQHPFPPAVQLLVGG